MFREWSCSWSNLNVFLFHHTARTLPTVSNKVTAVQLCRVAEIPCNYSIEWVRVHPTFRHRLKWEHARRTFIVLTPEIQNVPSPHRMITDTETRPIPIENPEESSNLVLPVDDTCRSIRGRVYYCPNQPIEYYKILGELFKGCTMGPHDSSRSMQVPAYVG